MNLAIKAQEGRSVAKNIVDETYERTHRDLTSSPNPQNRACHPLHVKQRA
jgi:hypothetical protein